MTYLLLLALLIGCATDQQVDDGDGGNEALVTDTAIGYHVSTSPQESTRVHELTDGAAEIAEENPDAEQESPDAAKESLDASDATEESPDAAEESLDASDATEESPDAAEESPDAAEKPLIISCDVTGSWTIRIITYSMWCFSTDAAIAFELTGNAPDCRLSGEREFNLPNTGFGAFTGTMVYSLVFKVDSVNGTAEISGRIEGSALGPCETVVTLKGNRE